VIVVIRMVGEC